MCKRGSQEMHCCEWQTGIGNLPSIIASAPEYPVLRGRYFNSRWELREAQLLERFSFNDFARIFADQSCILIVTNLPIRETMALSGESADSPKLPPNHLASLLGRLENRHQTLLRFGKGKIVVRRIPAPPFSCPYEEL